MLSLTNESLLSFLKNKDFDAAIQENTDQIHIKLMIDKREFPLFLRIYKESGLLQLLVFLPCTLEQKKAGEMGRLLHMLNKEIDIPGFGMDEIAGVVFFRCILPSLDKQVHEENVEALLGTIRTIAESFSPAVEALAAGAVSFEEMLQKAEQMQKQTGEKPTKESS